jgi:hypothetical protein
MAAYKGGHFLVLDSNMDLHYYYLKLKIHKLNITGVGRIKQMRV